MAASAKTYPSNTAFIDSLIEAFFNHQQVRLNKILEDLVARNQLLGGHEMGFYALGRVFSLYGPIKRKGQALGPAHHSLDDEVAALDQERLALDRDKLRLTQSLTVVATPCKSVEELRDALPESFAAHVPAFRGMNRTRPEGWVLDERPALKGQFERMAEIALRYEAYRLIY